ncbi:hypothetical protein EPN44_10330 [bacterium]|nr:MAG: hypothetical protein EPN44_10330 [bacterium]
MRPRALESTEHGIVRVNLLEREPSSAAWLARAPRALPMLALALATAAAGAHIAAARSTELAAWTTAQRTAAEARAAPVRRLRSEVSHLERSVIEGERLRATGPKLAAALAQLAADLPPASWLTSLELADDGTLRIAGRAPGFATVGEVLASLDRSQVFGAPRLLDAQRPAGAAALRFQIETR